MKRHLRVVALLASLSLAAACTSGGRGSHSSSTAASNVGVTATTVTIGSHQPLTGPSAPGFAEIAPASRAYFDYVNAHGGVNGRKIVYDYRDDAGTPAQAVTVVHQLVEQDKVFAVLDGRGIATHTAVVGYLNAHQVPDLFVGSECTCWDQPATYPSTFGYAPDAVREGKGFGLYARDVVQAKRVAYFTEANQFGKDAVRGLDTFLPASSVVSRQIYSAGSQDMSPQMAAIAAAGADAIVAFFSTPAQTAQLRLAQRRAGNHAQLLVSNVSSDPTTVAALIEASAKQGGVTVQGGPLIQGMISNAFLVQAGDTSTDWPALFTKVRDQYAPKLPMDGNVVYGMSVAYTFVQALARAGNQPTRQSLIAAVEKGGFEGPELVPLGYSSASHAGATGIQAAVVQGGNLVLQATPVTIDVAGNRDALPYHAPVPAVPKDGIPTP